MRSGRQICRPVLLFAKNMNLLNCNSIYTVLELRKADFQYTESVYLKRISFQKTYIFTSCEQ